MRQAALNSQLYDRFTNLWLLLSSQTLNCVHNEVFLLVLMTYVVVILDLCFF